MTQPTLKAGEVKYQLELSWNTLCDIELAFDGLGIFEVVNRFADGTRARLSDFHRIVEVTIRDADGKRLAPELVREITQIAGPEAVTQAVADALAQILTRLGTVVKS